MRYMAVSNALYATPKDILLGLTDGQGNTPEYTRLASASP